MYSYIYIHTFIYAPHVQVCTYSYIYICIYIHVHILNTDVCDAQTRSGCVCFSGVAGGGGDEGTTFRRLAVPRQMAP